MDIKELKKYREENFSVSVAKNRHGDLYPEKIFLKIVYYGKRVIVVNLLPKKITKVIEVLKPYAK